MTLLDIPGERLTRAVLPETPAVGDYIKHRGQWLIVVGRQWDADERRLVLRMSTRVDLAVIGPELVECLNCGGTGSVSVPTQGAEGCLGCNGTGLVREDG